MKVDLEQLKPDFPMGTREKSPLRQPGRRLCKLIKDHPDVDWGSASSGSLATPTKQLS